ncbi:hypothetical protein Har1130_14580 [Haloarcula sp. CBA1130]|uniref:hypothetical protein n=1 Tax=unclassified Haloarcula TaxID=2624677 RepID=UPI0012489DAC|nr:MULTISPECIES: hypothetical protein [unclassified Haloarcula]KAA9399398.1 hypothetical protein Har1129_14680 [Haloarcula sp. CBA1129]KAA9403914.1 hypothetical protein Har1130_14580 [Haloarcula sp. CBA1130]
MTDDRSNPDFDRDEMAHNADPGPDHSRTYRLFRWLTDNLLLMASGVGIVLFVIASILGYEFPRSLRLIGLCALVTIPLVGRPTGKKVRSLLWDPNYVWLVDIDARRMKGGIFRMPGQRFKEWSVEDGQLDWVSPNLAFGKNVDLEAQTVDGCWRGTLSDRELMRTLQAVEECRGQLEADAKRGFAIEAQAFTVIRNATRKAVLRIVSTFERGTLPDEGEGLTDEIDSAIEQFGLDRKIRAAEDDESPEADVPGIRVDFDQDLADLAGAGDGGVSADD